MDPIKQQPQLPHQIICDKVFYQRLQCFEDNESVKIYLFPFKNVTKKSLNFVILDMSRCKTTQQSKLKEFNKEQFIQTCQAIYSGTQKIEVLIYTFSSKSIVQLLSQDSENVRIVNPDIKQVNRMLRECAIITLKLPSGFYENQDCNYSLEGYKFNPIGKIRQNWGFVNNGRVLKGLFAAQNQKIKKQLKQNVVYSKNQLRTILELIQNVDTLANSQDKQSKVFQELSVLGQNFLHHQKLIANSNNLLPIIHFEIELVCSLGRGESCKNKVGNQNIKINQHAIHDLCLNFTEGIAHCQQAINSKIQAIFTKGNTQTSLLSTSDNLCLSTMPTKLVNPHLFLKTEVKQKFSQYYVKGLYEYYHYGDHNFNDQGWGCAYRSLESLLSWFRLQQKLNLLTVPTVPQIQNLIDLIDCTSQQKLSNTKTWIGATQVSWVVKKLTGFDCRILHIKDGKDIVEHAEMFRDHLQNVGTPIMYGGDAYAYSIVGINYSWKLGEIMFCILDPHYNGSDKIDKIIQKKGICWRKPEEMFKKGVFYNFCLPIL